MNPQHRHFEGCTFYLIYLKMLVKDCINAIF